MNIRPGIKLHVIPTKKFKDIEISVRFVNVLDKQKASARSLLALLLCDRSETYDTKAKMNSHQDVLYGASIHAQTMGYGKSQVMQLRLKTINPEYVINENTLMDQIFAYLQEVLFHPLLQEDAFEEAKMMLLAKLARNDDDPAQYAITQGLKLAGEGTSLALSSLGEKDVVEALCLDDIKRAYEDMLSQDMVTIIICGDVDEEEMKTKAEHYIPLQERINEVETFYIVANDVHDKYQEAYKNISQTSIMMVWFTNTSIADSDFYALRVANAMFGQYSTSLLFQEVREKNSLCYSIFSNLIAYDGALGVTTGVEKEHVDKTIALVRTQFSRLCNGDFDEELLQVSKQMIVNSLKASNDNMNSLIALQFQNDALSRMDTSEDIIAMIESVSFEEIVQVCQKCELKMTFVVTKEGEVDEEN